MLAISLVMLTLGAEPRQLPIIHNDDAERFAKYLHLDLKKYEKLTELYVVFYVSKRPQMSVDLHDDKYIDKLKIWQHEFNQAVRQPCIVSKLRVLKDLRADPGYKREALRELGHWSLTYDQYTKGELPEFIPSKYKLEFQQWLNAKGYRLQVP
jgi:hypothetical protein